MMRWDVATATAKRNRLIKPAGSGPHDIAGVWRRPLGDYAAAVRISHADDGVIIRRRRARLEGFQNGPAAVAGSGAHAALGVDADQLDPGGNLERDRRLVGERELEEVARDRGGEMTAGGGVAVTKRTRLVKAEIDADNDVRREADEPGILRFIGGAGLAGDRLADFLDRDRRTALDH